MLTSKGRTYYCKLKAINGKAPNEQEVASMLATMNRHIKNNHEVAVGSYTAFWAYEIESDDMILGIMQKVRKEI